MWCDNILEVTGPFADIEMFRFDMRRVVPHEEGYPVELPISFGALLPRPTELDLVEESSVGLRGYQALYGDWRALLELSWIRESGIKDRAGLIRRLEESDPNHFYLAQRYRANEVRFGFRNWYAWNLEHYGTSQEAESAELVEQSAERLVYWFKTFETPPLAWLKRLRESYPMLRIVLRHRNPWKAAMAAGSSHRGN